MMMMMVMMKEKLRDGEIKSYQWVSTKQMWADGLTKEMEMADGLWELLKTGRCELVKEEVNKVVCEKEEIKMLNIRKRKRRRRLRRRQGGEPQKARGCEGPTWTKRRQ